MKFEHQINPVNPFLMGEKIYLRPVCKDDLRSLQRWANDPETRKIIGEVMPTGAVETEKWFEDLIDDESRVWFMVVLRENNKIIGETGLMRMSHPWRATDLTMIIGEEDERGKGYGSEAINLLLDFAFGSLNFHRVAIGVVGFNENAIKFYERVGFKKEGVQRDGYFYNHQYYDFVMMSILDREYRELHGIQV